MRSRRRYKPGRRPAQPRAAPIERRLHSGRKSAGSRGPGGALPGSENLDGRVSEAYRFPGCGPLDRCELVRHDWQDDL
jgi:hypothetical protein